MTNPNQSDVSMTTMPQQSERTAVPSHESKKLDSDKLVAEEQRQMKSLVSQITNMPEANLASPPTFMGTWHRDATHALGQHNLGHHQAQSFASLNNIHPSSLHQQLLHAKSIG
uniref:Uncharacterized protein n=1 Tax=Leptocylindrus danicus TaxID=163516 RepID=A0A7S2KWT2_9STRA|mmetsp:Transcript_28267/g.41598  ORF Transcript_28267/g.41598 Transcript_28267/m.41598 type:complete len:113 (+) Transcript_28267:20-358(+)